MSKLKYFIEESWLLIASAFLFGLLIAVANAAWSPIIEQNRIEKLNTLMRELLPEAARFEKVTELEIEDAKGRDVKTSVYKGLSDSNSCLGWAFIASGSGFQDKIELVVGVDRNFEKFSGFAVLFSNETPGFGDKIKLTYYRSQFAGAPVTELSLVKTGDDKRIDSEIVAISGATVSSEAVVETINNAAGQVKEQLRQKGLLGNGG
jgi:electron transport complex protein RnfG